MNTVRSVCVGLMLAALATPAAAQTFNDIELGKKLFDGICARCHGFDGVGGEGPNLNKPTLNRAPDDQSLTAVIRDGIPARGMPRVRRLSANETQQLVAYVRSLGQNAPVATSGNASNGKAVYEKSNCANCHVIKGQGGTLGPELSAIGSRRSPLYLQQALEKPGETLPRGVLSVPGRGFDEFLLLRIVPRNGQPVQGMRVNEDPFTIQIKDANNQFHSFRKVDVQISKASQKSLMPSYKDRLSVGERDDLIAYLLSLRGGN